MSDSQEPDSSSSSNNPSEVTIDDSTSSDGENSINIVVGDNKEYYPWTATARNLEINDYCNFKELLIAFDTIKTTNLYSQKHIQKQDKTDGKRYQYAYLNIWNIETEI
ncbi:hypothetical protein M0802_010062 [Mischocyttarus mexicanus]|nr:hypothetical protein M0802_010062 [Mischocyttarus mexicanus]